MKQILKQGLLGFVSHKIDKDTLEKHRYSYSSIADELVKKIFAKNKRFSSA